MDPQRHKISDHEMGYLVGLSIAAANINRDATSLLDRLNKMREEPHLSAFASAIYRNFLRNGTDCTPILTAFAERRDSEEYRKGFIEATLDTTKPSDDGVADFLPNESVSILPPINTEGFEQILEEIDVPPFVTDGGDSPLMTDRRDIVGGFKAVDYRPLDEADVEIRLTLAFKIDCASNPEAVGELTFSLSEEDARRMQGHLTASLTRIAQRRKANEN